MKNPIQIHDVHWKEWLRETLGDSFFDHYTIDWTWPQELWTQFRDFPPHAAIAELLLQQIWAAVTYPAGNSRELRDEMQEVVMQPIEEF